MHPNNMQEGTRKCLVDKSPVHKLSWSWPWRQVSQVYCPARSACADDVMMWSSRHASLVHTFPEGRPLALTSTGGQPVPMVHFASTPSCTRPSTRSSMGRSLIRATPSSTNRPRPAAATAAVSGRMAVPAFPKNSSAPWWGRGGRQSAMLSEAEAAHNKSVTSPTVACSTSLHQMGQTTPLCSSRLMTAPLDVSIQ